MAAFDALVDAVDRQQWPDFQREPILYYFSRMIAVWLLRLMDHALSDERLCAVSPVDMTALTLLFFRDMFRHNCRLLRPDSQNADWVEELFYGLASDFNVPKAKLQDDGQPYDLEDIANCEWARSLAVPFGLPAEKLFACHSSIVTGACGEYGGSA